MGWGGSSSPFSMATLMDRPLQAKSVLVKGAVRPWHLVFICAAALAVSDVASFKLTQGESAAFSPIARDLLRYLISGALILAFVLGVPELRRPLPVLFARSPLRISKSGLAIALMLALCWGYGIYRFAVCMPLVLAHPGLYGALGFYERLDPFEARRLLFLAGIVFVAPVAEELMFRGYLMNLWIARWGLWAGMLLSSLVFGLFHFERAIFAAPMGLVFALVYRKHDSLWPAIAVHAAYNLLAFPWLLGGFFYVKPRAQFNELGTWAMELVLSVAFVPLAIAFWRRFAPGD